MIKMLISILLLTKIALGSALATDTEIEMSEFNEAKPLLSKQPNHEITGIELKRLHSNRSNPEYGSLDSELEPESESRCSECYHNSRWYNASRAENALTIYKLLTLASTAIPLILELDRIISPNNTKGNSSLIDMEGNSTLGHSLIYPVYSSVELFNFFVYSLVISEFPKTTFTSKCWATMATTVLTALTTIYWMKWYAGEPLPSLTGLLCLVSLHTQLSIWYS